MTLKNAQVAFVQHLREQNRAHATILAYGKDTEQLVDHLIRLTRTVPSEVTKKDLESFMYDLMDKGFTPKSVSRKTNSTKTFFKYLKSIEEIKEDPALGITHPRFENKPLRFLSKLEYRALRDACRNDKRTAAIVELLLQTGIRVGEVSALKKSDVEFGGLHSAGTLHVTSNDNKKRLIPLNAAAVQAIKDWLNQRPDKSDKLFLTKSGRPLLVRNIRTAIDRYFMIAGIEGAKVNDLRHTFILYQLEIGVPLLTVSRIAGHKRLSTTERYLEYLEKTREHAIELGEL